jgi:dCMP deaminase
MKSKYINLYMNWAIQASKLSHAKRLQVGAVVVKDDTVISYGYNGMPAGWDNNCEYKEFMSIDAGTTLDINEIKEYWPFEETSDEDGAYIGRYRLKTRPEVMHAERNALDKLAKKGNIGGEDASMFITHAPCLECAKSIYSAGIKEIFYKEEYRSVDGIAFLKNCGIKIEKYHNLIHL